MNRTRDEDLAAIGLLDEPNRRALYDWVVAQGRPVGREEAAKALGLTRPLATFHLDRLTEGGLLDGGYRRLSGRTGPGAGRPARVYWRSERELSVSLPARRYERVAELFATALERMSERVPPKELKRAARTFGTQLGSRTSGRTPARRLTSALEEGGYEPVTDASGTIRLRNCPFDALVDDHRDLVCGTNLATAEGIVRGTGADVVPALDPQPGFCCVTFRQPA